MKNLFKFLLVLLIGFILCLVLVLVSNMIYFGGDKQVYQQVDISGQSESEFVAETVSTSGNLSFYFTPKGELSKDYYFSYTLVEGENETEVVENKLEQDISAQNPIELSISRKADLKYSLETIITDVDNPSVVLHQDKIIIYPQDIKLDKSIQDKAEEYIRDNINELSPEKAVLGGTFYVTDIKFNDNTAIVDYEDGHIALRAYVEFKFSGGDFSVDKFNIFK